MLSGVSTGRIARPMMYARLPGLASIDRFYYTAANVDRRTISPLLRLHPGGPRPVAMRQLDRYLRTGRLVSADGKFDYAAHLNRGHDADPGRRGRGGPAGRHPLDR